VAHVDGGKLMGRNIRAISGSNGLAALNPKQEIAALALASGRTLQEAAQQADVGETTLKRWLADQPEMRDRVRELRRDLTDRAAGILAEAMTEAALTLKRLCHSKSEHVQLRAAEALLTHGREANGLADLQSEVDQLKALAATTTGRGHQL
jgi:transposase-like protein